MSEHDSERGHHRGHETHAQEKEAAANPRGPYWRRAHRSWGFWLMVGLMLAAMFTYVMTMDEALPPGGPVKAVVPAAP